MKEHAYCYAEHMKLFIEAYKKSGEQRDLLCAVNSFMLWLGSRCPAACPFEGW